VDRNSRVEVQRRYVGKIASVTVTIHQPRPAQYGGVKDEGPRAKTPLSAQASPQ